jgi:hypothetical protein
MRLSFSEFRWTPADAFRGAVGVHTVDVRQPFRAEQAIEGAPLFCFDNAALIEEKPPMAKKPGTNPKGEFAFFNVVYEDDSQRSNRRVPSELLGGLDGDEPARAYIMEQDREIAEKSGRTPLAIKSISRVGAKKK